MPAMSGYTKLFNSILASTVWREPMETRIVWITLLAMADKDGIAEASVPGLADFARVSVEATREALERLSAPDPDSRSKEHDGRRIEAVEGGWQLLNHSKYRAKMGADERREYNRIKQAQYRERQKKSITVNHNERNVHIAEADTEAKALKPTPRAAPSNKNPFNPTEAAVSLAREYGIIGVEEISLLKDALTFQQGDPMANAKLILDAWLVHKDSGAFPQQFKAFIKQGHWKPKPKPKRKYLTDDDEYTKEANA